MFMLESLLQLRPVSLNVRQVATACRHALRDNRSSFPKCESKRHHHSLTCNRKHTLRCLGTEFRHRHQNDLQIEKSSYSTLKEMTPEEKAKKFHRPVAQTTIDEEEVSKFSALSALWWDEGGEFEALHSLNDLRVPLVRDALVSKKTLDKYDKTKPLDGFWVLDIGSGGGILSEPLARLGASVVGVDASEENIKIAQAHLIHDAAIRERVKYVHTTVEEIAQTQAGKFDAVVASEVLEHVADANTLVTSACQLVRPGGSVFFTTLNKTRLAYLLGVVVAENVLRLVSPGTHDWNKFVSPKDLSYMLDRNNFATRLIHGMQYNPFTKRWSWSKDTSINYALHAVKSTDNGKPDVWTESQKPFQLAGNV